ncbi:MAG: M20/M25/M40 family metallo-hydrolase [Blautia sp.]|nr:M20/M25/M40 family metallo-hydrolase [Blautia sp.]
MKKFLTLFLFLLVGTNSVAFAGNAVSPDAVDFARTVTQTIADMGDNSDVGNRSSGSPAEKQAAAFIEQTMKDIGLQNVTVDPFTVDNWTFNRARVYYTDADGEQQFFPLGGFATNLTCDMQEVSVVYVGRGTAEEYEGLDVEGKVVLFDIDQAEDWWVEIPAYEAHLHGALCSLVCNVSGYAYYDADTIGSQDYCGPDDVPAFALSQNSAAILRRLAEENGGEAKVILDVDSVVTHDGQSQNIWGEIPGATDEVIYFFAHYDGYYHSFFDDASGVGTMLSIARELVNSGYTPDKTIRFVAHGAEEWGHADTEYDWSAGAYAEITQTHPEWADTGFVVLNIDGMYPVQGHTAFAAAATYEVEDFAAMIGTPVYADGSYGFEAKSPTTCWTEDFGYVRAGVPAIVASHAEPESIYHGPAYHSTMDNVILGVDEAAWAKTIELFRQYALSLDSLAARPMNFSNRFQVMSEIYEGSADIDSYLQAAAALDGKIAALNSDYASALENNDVEAAASLREEGLALDAATQPLFKDIVAATTAFDWEDNTVFPFEQTNVNIEALEAAIAALREGNVITALEDCLTSVDYNWYAYSFSRETYDYMLDKMFNKAVGTWGEDMIRFDGENLWTLMHGLMEKTEDDDFAAEISELEAALARQQENRTALDEQMTGDIAQFTERILSVVEG